MTIKIFLVGAEAMGIDAPGHDMESAVSDIYSVNHSIEFAWYHEKEHRNFTVPGDSGAKASLDVLEAWSLFNKEKWNTATLSQRFKTCSLWEISTQPRLVRVTQNSDV